VFYGTVPRCITTAFFTALQNPGTERWTWNPLSPNHAIFLLCPWATSWEFQNCQARSGACLGECTGIDLPGERSGVMPSPEWKERIRKSKWYAGETISVSIGQGAVSVTPLQILRAESAVITGGNLVTPHVVLHTASSSPDPNNWPTIQLPVGEENARRIRQGMWNSVNNYGTGHNAQIPGLDICGKTGTVQILSKETRAERSVDASEFEDHSWFRRICQPG